MTYKMPIPDCYDAIQDLNCYSAERMLEAYKAGAEQHEPVAWRVRFGESTAWTVYEYQPTQSMFGTNIEVRPLYAAPVQPKAEPLTWQPIETAPKDFVTVFDGWNGDRVCDLLWTHPECSPKGHFAFCASEYTNGHGWDNVEVKGLTHWMPVPNGPKAATKGPK